MLSLIYIGKLSNGSYATSKVLLTMAFTYVPRLLIYFQLVVMMTGPVALTLATSPLVFTYLLALMSFGLPKSSIPSLAVAPSLNIGLLLPLSTRFVGFVPYSMTFSFLLNFL